ncbi:hypothetical protein BASA81_008298 [Batrachochytrium salamandrivorans]|nr:hypothetical protein BASA81_008298 [Batrachochytrium salamandrivorans]
MSKPAKSKKRQAKAGASMKEEKGIVMVDEMAAPNADVNAQPPKEFSGNLQQLKFMARMSNSSKPLSSTNTSAAALAVTQSQLPETTLADSIYNPCINIPVPIVLRKGLEFARDSDAVLEIAMLQSRNKRLNNPDKPSKQGKFFITKGENLDQAEDEGSDADIDDAALAKHFAKQKKQQQKRNKQM